MQTRLGLGLARQPVQSGVGYLPETTAWNDAIVGAGGTSQPTSVLKAVNTLVTSLINSGVWDKLDTINVAGVGFASLLVNLKDPNVVGSAVNSPDYQDYKGAYGADVDSYIDTGYNLDPSGVAGGTNVTNYGADGGTLYAFLSVLPSDTPAFIGSRTGINDDYNYLTSLNIRQFRDSAQGAGGTIEIGSVAGCCSASGMSEYVVNGVQVDNYDQSSDFNVSNVADGAVYTLGRSDLNTGENLNPMSDGRLASYAIGKYLTSSTNSSVETENKALHTAMLAYMRAIGAVE